MFVDHMCEYFRIKLTELAKIGGVSPSTLSTWKRDGRSIEEVPYGVVERWAWYFNTEPKWLVAMFR